MIGERSREYDIEIERKHDGLACSMSSLTLAIMQPSYIFCSCMHPSSFLPFKIFCNLCLKKVALVILLAEVAKLQVTLHLLFLDVLLTDLKV